MEMVKKDLMQREKSLEEKEETILKMHQSLHEGAQNLVGTVVEQAEQRHKEVMESQQVQFQGQLEQMQNQLIWLTALAGENRDSGGGWLKRQCSSRNRRRVEFPSRGGSSKVI
jgi:hypothetical protein